jgi:hypothetical protein
MKCKKKSKINDIDYIQADNPVGGSSSYQQNQDPHHHFYQWQLLSRLALAVVPY